MKQFVITIAFLLAAALSATLAWSMRPAPPNIERLSEQGTTFYPDFTDPLNATSLEVIQFDDESGSTLPFKVEFKNGAWTIPSHYNYPADGKDRLARTAASVIDLKRDILQSTRAQDHEQFGVVDPLDINATSITGRGERITLRGESGNILADYIIGDPVPGKQNFRYVRLPDSKRTYQVKLNIDLSTRFADWINTDLLELQQQDIAAINVNDYSIDESTGTFNQVGRVQLNRAEDNSWSIADLPAVQAVDETKINAMLGALDRLTITGVRPKPASMTADLQAQEGITLDMPTRLSLESKGFFVAKDGRLLSNEGEITITTKAGVRYTLRFGEVLYGEGLSVSAGSEESAENENTAEQTEQAGKENRYVFITADFDSSLLPPKPAPPAPTETTVSEADQKAYEQTLAEWQKQFVEGNEKARALNHRFAEWYYVISATDFQALRPSVHDLVKTTETE